MITIKSSEFGKRRYVDCDCVCQNGIFLTPERCTDVCDLTCGYLIGDKEPHYPMPATLQDADMATNHRWICGHCPEPIPCENCIDEYLDALDYWYVTGMGK